jgi:lysine 2,3-aminomutase
MSDWQKTLHQSIDSLEKLHAYVADRFGADVAAREIDVAALQPAFDKFQMRITPAALDLIQAPGDAMWNQYIPTTQELDVVDGVVDSLDEDGDSPVPNITHRYPDRVLFLVSPVCASYCRFCTRRRKVGDPEKIPLNQYESAFEYIAAHPEVRDVILSGGDPMMLSDRRLEYIFQRLRAIPHVEIIRIGSRITSHLPERITDEFCQMVKKYHPVYMNTHFDHPGELTPAAVAALARLADAGVPLGCQTVLLRGVNDDPAIMKDLMQKLLRARVRPYYIYMADQVAGGEHFRTTVEKGLEIVKALRGWTSGLAVPHFVIDAPGGGGKVPLLPEYVEEITDDEVVFRNYEGKRFVYKQPRQSAVVNCDSDNVVPIRVASRASKKAVRPRRKTGS